MPFALPESYASYVAEPAVKTAVDHILGSKSLRVPDTLDWNELPDFHAAVLAAHQVRCDFASALQGLWNAVWPTAIDEAGIGGDQEAWSIAEAARWYGVGFDAESLWGPGVFTRAYTRADSYMGLGVNLDLLEARLIFWFGDQNEKDLVGNRLPTDEWASEQSDYGYWSTMGLAPIRDGSVSLERLNAAASRALVAITG
ncbi:MAG: hypothetical protein OXN81_10525 [Alphaproteobacteria bacterium]|nr:hypothetical protein [Alphaproteobacteria bacterium]